MQEFALIIKKGIEDYSIRPGDKVIISREEPKSGDIIAYLLDGPEVKISKIWVINEGIFIGPEEGQRTPAEGLMILGRVIELRRDLGGLKIEKIKHNQGRGRTIEKKGLLKCPSLYKNRAGNTEPLPKGIRPKVSVTAFA